MNNTGEKTLCVGKDKVMGNGVTIIVGAGAVLDFDHKGIFRTDTPRHIDNVCLRGGLKRIL